MIDQVSMEKLRKKGSVDISRENRWVQLKAGRKERILKRKNNNSGSLENNIMNEYNNNRDFKLSEEIAMSLVSKKVEHFIRNIHVSH